MKNVVLYPGTFDPITYGHIDLIHRACELFDEVIVGVGINSKKTALLSLEKRIELAEAALADRDNIQVTAFAGLTTDFAHECGANIILRGLRTGADFEYEYQLHWLNKHLAPEVETLFMAPSKEFAGISSSLVKEIARYNGELTAFVPPLVAAALEDAFN